MGSGRHCGGGGSPCPSDQSEEPDHAGSSRASVPRPDPVTAVTAFHTFSLHRRRATPPDAGMALRLHVYVNRRGLDREIALGGSCQSNEALALRAQQLTQRRTRQRIAGNLRRIVAYVDRAGSRRDLSAVVTDRAAVSAGRQSILGLAE